jgi:hypothetical protein
MCEVSRAAAARDGADSVLICTLTRAAAAEIGARLPDVPAEAIGTLHAHCYRSMDQATVIPSPKKPGSDLTRMWNDQNPRFALSSSGGQTAYLGLDGAKAVKATGGPYLELYTIQRARLAGDLTAVPASHRGVISRSGMSAFIDRWEAFKAKHDAIDFQDMIDRAIISERPAPGGPRHIFVDEAQDCSAAEIRLTAHTWGQHADRVIWYGDLDQTIYGWRGADPRAFLELGIPPERLRVLGQSYRIPAAVHTVSQRLIATTERIEAPYKPRNGAGRVERSYHSYRSGAGRLLDHVEQHTAAGRSVMVLATCGYMLKPIVDLAHERGILFSNKYKRDVPEWNPLGVRRKGTVLAVDRLRAFFDVTIKGGWMAGRMDRWLGLCSVNDMLVRGAKKKISDMPPEQCLTLGGEWPATPTPTVDWDESAWATGEGLPMPTVDHTLDSQGDAEYYPEPPADDDWDETDEQPDFLEYEPIDLFTIFKTRELAEAFVQARDDSRAGWLLRHLSGAQKTQRAIRYAIGIVERHGPDVINAEPLLTVGTCHSVKGGEADVVFLSPDVSPATAQQMSIPAERDHVTRVFYVGMTRAKDSLFLCSASGKSVSWPAVSL